MMELSGLFGRLVIKVQSAALELPMSLAVIQYERPQNVRIRCIYRHHVLFSGLIQLARLINHALEDALVARENARLRVSFIGNA